MNVRTFIAVMGLGLSLAGFAPSTSVAAGAGERMNYEAIFYIRPELKDSQASAEQEYIDDERAAYDALDAGDYAASLTAFQAADDVKLPEWTYWRDLPTVAYLQLKTGDLDAARRTARIARADWELNLGLAKCPNDALMVINGKEYPIPPLRMTGSSVALKPDEEEEAVNRVCGGFYQDDYVMNPSDDSTGAYLIKLEIVEHMLGEVRDGR